MKELDCTDLVRTLNAQADPGPWPHVHHPRPGGSTNVGPMDTIAGVGCWCGAHYGHDWPGKANGAPHPRGTWVDRDGVDTLEEL